MNSNFLSWQVHSDFVAAATRGAMAVIDGNVMAINPGEEAKMQMYIWNNIFFSLGFDVRDHYKQLGGDAAAFVAPVRNINPFYFSYCLLYQHRIVRCILFHSLPAYGHRHDHHVSLAQLTALRKR